MTEFKKLGLSSKITDVLEELKFKTPSEIQEKTIPLILQGKDVIGNAATGSGKTLAFASGIVEKLVPRQGVQALILTPTRELAEQVAKVLRVFAKKTQLSIQDVYGGVGMDRQITGIKRSEIIVGTPGRILDHLQRQTLNLSKISVLVLDEADRMADMGFLPDVEKIISQCSKKRQTLLFSATSSQEVNHLSKKYMHNPIQVSVNQYVDPSKLQQYYYDTPSHLKFSLLVHLLKEEKSGIVMVFCNTRRNVDLVSMNLERYKINSQAIHGGLNQSKRSRVMAQFHNNEAEILVCTDVAARGLDIKDVSHVYNYDIPHSPEEYIHRVGRTARAGKEGMAVSIVTNKDYDNFRSVLEDDSLKITKLEIPVVEELSPNFQSGRDNRTGGGERGGFRRQGGGRNFGNNSRGGFSRNKRFSDRGERPRRDSNSQGRRPEGNRRYSDRRSDNRQRQRRRF